MPQSVRYPDIQLDVSNLGCIRGGRPVFGALGLSCRSGEAVRLTGPNGAGKSSLLRILAELLPATVGDTRWTIDGSASSAAPPLAYCGHRDPVKPWLTVREHLNFWRCLDNASTDDSGADAAAASEFGLATLLDIPGGLLSAGQKRRLALSRLMVVQAPVWLLDEPTVSLDHDGVDLFETAVARHREAGGLIIVATHTVIRLPDTRELDLETFASSPIAA